MRRLTVAAVSLAFLSVVVGGAARGQAASAIDSWVGKVTLGGPGEITLTLSGNRVLVALGVGHADIQAIPLSRTGGHVRFLLPGRPAPVAFDGTIAGNRLSGTVRQGSVHGTFSARPGTGAGLTARGFYRVGTGISAVVADPYGPARLVDLDSGRVRAIYSAGAGFSIGSGFATLSPATGTARFGPGAATIDGKRAARVQLRQLEVRFRSGATILSGTLTLPPGGGKHPAAVFVAGSGPTQRAYLPELQAHLVRHGIAVLVYDKRGIGQSGGSYTGESPTASSIDTLARDAEAATRFLAAQPEVDRSRVGLEGHSQAGWIAPLAAAREPAIRFMLLYSGPAVTADENDTYQSLAGRGEKPSPRLPTAEIETRVAARGPGGVDPIPSIRKLKIPALWVYGGLDTFVPPGLSARRLAPLAKEPGRDFTVVEFPNANHAMVETTTGLTSEMLRSDTYAPGMFARVAEWLREHGLR